MIHALNLSAWFIERLRDTYYSALALKHTPQGPSRGPLSPSLPRSQKKRERPPTQGKKKSQGKGRNSPGTRSRTLLRGEHRAEAQPGPPHYCPEADLLVLASSSPRWACLSPAATWRHLAATAPDCLGGMILITVIVGLFLYALITSAIWALIINNNNLVQTLLLLCNSEYLDSNYLSYFNIYGINQTF